MDKEELMKMARDCAGVAFSFSAFDGGCQAELNECQLQAFASAILERAALECDKLAKDMEQDDHMQGCKDCASEIRALKPSNDA